MKRASFALLALVLLAGSSGCCCLDRLFCWGCRGPCAYGHEGPSCGGCGGGGCSDCGGYAGGGPSGGGGGYADGSSGGGGYNGGAPARSMEARPHPAQGPPHAFQRRNSGGEYEFAAGPPTGATTYPYYTTRGPRDFLARNPRSIGP